MLHIIMFNTHHNVIRIGASMPCMEMHKSKLIIDNIR